MKGIVHRHGNYLSETRTSSLEKYVGETMDVKGKSSEKHPCLSYIMYMAGDSLYLGHFNLPFHGRLLTEGN